MKVPPKRKGNGVPKAVVARKLGASMKVPPKRKGNAHRPEEPDHGIGLNESPSEKEGKSLTNRRAIRSRHRASMKVPPKRKGNTSPNR